MLFQAAVLLAAASTVESMTPLVRALAAGVATRWRSVSGAAETSIAEYITNVGKRGRAVGSVLAHASAGCLGGCQAACRNYPPSSTKTARQIWAPKPYAGAVAAAAM